MLRSRVIWPVVGLLGLTDSVSAEENRWVNGGVEAFDRYCFTTDAERGRLRLKAEADGLEVVPEDDARRLAGVDRPMAAYIVDVDAETFDSVIVMHSVPDECGVQINGAPAAEIRRQFVDVFKLVRAGVNDVGLSRRELFVPGGSRGNLAEAARLGVVVVITSKRSAESEAALVTFFPSRSIEMVRDDIAE